MDGSSVEHEERVSKGIVTDTFYDAYVAYMNGERQKHFDLLERVHGSRQGPIAKVVQKEVQPLSPDELTQSIGRMGRAQRIEFARMVMAAARRSEDSRSR